MDRKKTRSMVDDHFQMSLAVVIFYFGTDCTRREVESAHKQTPHIVAKRYYT